MTNAGRNGKSGNTPARPPSSPYLLQHLLPPSSRCLAFFNTPTILAYSHTTTRYPRNPRTIRHTRRAMAEATDQITTPSSSSDELQLTITHHGTPHIFTLPSTSTISDLSTAISNDLSIPSSHQKLLITPRVGLLRAPFKDPTLPLSTLTSKKILLMGSTAAEVSQITSASTTSHEQSLRRAAGGPIKPATPSRTHNLTRTLEEAQYTFHTLRPLPYLPDPSRSLALLSRLRSDPGIKATMRRHKFSVPLLTEMDPAAHTTHASRTLGLNRNRGEVIELRLRTDAGDGYRDYKTIRRTLCHELAHNVWGEHDGRFWELCRRIEREVERDDWTRGGRSVGEEVFYEPDVGGAQEGKKPEGTA
ncbi:WLM-domain-containing protein [Patellaria atrata CBS 101060]|uniref:WLM-domain-containing protein n=1 Tax=Patellaria atrata CBS 101060 TaxID=1346257 RepID=A0A9P4SCQ3_9PEZI|nr:WLM-domain-containing protein [Patellaria atrata CBS 101060]